jgi:predicted transcriptional regulator of viral defense system
VRRGLYITVPLAAKNPSSQREDPWIVAMSLYAPGYIGGWSACEHWGFTEQIFTDVVMYTTRHVRTRKQQVQDTSFILRVVTKGKMWGTAPVWRSQTKVLVSDPARTLADILDEPRVGGGMRQVAEVVHSYFTSEHRDDRRLLAYVRRLGNRTICKRLGFLVETLGVEAPAIMTYCQSHLSAGYSKLDPTVTARGRLTRRWNLEVNVHLGTRPEAP